MKKITTAIVYDHRGRPAADGKGQVEIRVTYGRKSYYVGTGIRVLRNEFVAGQVVNCPGKAELNRRITIIYNKVLAYVNDCDENDTEVSIEALKDAAWKVSEQYSDEPLLLNWLESQVPLLAVGEGTRKHYYTMIARLWQFGKIKTWRDAMPENIYEFDAWLHGLEKPQTIAEKTTGAPIVKIGGNTVYNYHKCLRSMLTRAVNFGKIERNPYDRLRGQFRKDRRENTEYLTDEDIVALRTLELVPGTPLSLARDLFMLQLYTGMAYSDMQAFNFADYKLVDGRYINVGTRIKTGVAYVSELLPPAVEVVMKYGGTIPKVENHVYNRLLKVLGAQAGIKTPLHSHLARHTFATMMLSAGARIENVSKMLGHTNITQTQRYAKVLAQDVRADLHAAGEKIINHTGKPCGTV